MESRWKFLSNLALLRWSIFLSLLSGSRTLRLNSNRDGSKALSLHSNLPAKVDRIQRTGIWRGSFSAGVGAGRELSCRLLSSVPGPYPLEALTPPLPQVEAIPHVSRYCLIPTGGKVLLPGNGIIELV